MKVYLDNCSFNRPFDDQSQIRIRIEAEAKLYIQTLIKRGKLKLTWSYILEYENLANPYEIRQIIIQKWKQEAITQVNENNHVIKRAGQLVKHKLNTKDALHIACAIEADSEYFITTDDKILNKKNIIKDIQIVDPVGMLDILEV